MALLFSTILALRRDQQLQKLPPYLSALCVIIGVVWLLLLPLNGYSRGTYISENALLPGQVNTYFRDSEQNIFNAYLAEVQGLAGKPQEEVNAKLAEIFRSLDLKVATQKYEYEAAGNRYAGENVYAILQAPRGDATEAVVLVAALENMEGQLNQHGVALVLNMARYFKRWSLWSKDIIFLVTPDSKAGPQAWVDAYHGRHSSASIASLPLKSGALQGAIVVDNPLDHRFKSLHITYDGINGQLPNLDLFNTAVDIARGLSDMKRSLQHMFDHDDSYRARLQTMLRGMASQGLGHGSGPHSSFIPYHVDAITLTCSGDGPEDDMAIGRVVESMFRSLNNLMEHLHQSFFFYLLMHTNRFVSIGTYLPSAMLVAANFTIMAIALWILSGRPQKRDSTTKKDEKPTKPEMEIVQHDGTEAIIPKQELDVEERRLFLPVVLILFVHLLGVVPLYIFNNTVQAKLAPALHIFTLVNLVLPTLLHSVLSRYAHPTYQECLLIKCFSLLFLGMFLATLATLNFSLSFTIGLLALPLSFFGFASSPEEEQNQGKLRRRLAISNAVLHCLSPPVVFYAICYATGASVEKILTEAAFGWTVWGLWTQVVVWCVWWPAWLVGTVFVGLKV